MRTRLKFLKRGFIAASMLTLACCTAAAASTPSAVQEPHQVGSQNFAFAAGNAAAYTEQVNEYTWNAAAAQAAAQTQQAQEQVEAKAASDAVTYRGNATGSVNGYPCGGDLPPCYVLRRESGGNPTAQNRSSSASGLWQFLDSTWAGFGGYARAKDAPPSVQNEKARILWAGGAGCSHWSAC